MWERPAEADRNRSDERTQGRPERTAIQERATSPRPVIASLIFVVAVPVCAGAAAGAVYLGDALLGDTVPYSCGKRGLAVGLMGTWGACCSSS